MLSSRDRAVIWGLETLQKARDMEVVYWILGSGMWVSCLGFQGLIRDYVRIRYGIWRIWG